jgi:hypothetical protein
LCLADPELVAYPGLAIFAKQIPTG